MIHLQGASLDDAQLEGASLYEAQLQGASLLYAHLQGASLDAAKLQGAYLHHANLQGASLEGFHVVSDDPQPRVWGPGAQLQGASFYWAQLEGASLADATINATKYLEAELWRTKWEGQGQLKDTLKFGAILYRDSGFTWVPVRHNYGRFARAAVAWDAEAYAELRDSLNTIPEGKMRDEALKRIEILDCGNPDKTLASCDSAAASPPKVLDWQKKLAAASGEGAAYANALATEVRKLVCSSDDVDSIYILRGVMRGLFEPGQFAKMGREVPPLIEDIMKKCPVSASLTDDDEAKLLEIKQAAEQKSAPSPASKKEK